MKNKSLLLLWKRVSARKNTCKKLRRFKRIFLCKFGINKFAQFRIKITFLQTNSA